MAPGLYKQTKQTHNANPQTNQRNKRLPQILKRGETKRVNVKRDLDKTKELFGTYMFNLITGENVTSIPVVKADRERPQAIPVWVEEEEWNRP